MSMYQNSFNTYQNFTIIVKQGFPNILDVIFFSLFSDVNECEPNSEYNATCAVNAYCNNIIGSFQCICKPGYAGEPLRVGCFSSMKIFIKLF